MRSVEHGAGIGPDDRFGTGRADHGTENPARGVLQHGSDRMGEIAGLAKYLVETPAPAVGQARHLDGLDELIRRKRVLEHPGYEVLDCRRPASVLAADDDAGA